MEVLTGAVLARLVLALAAASIQETPVASADAVRELRGLLEQAVAEQAPLAAQATLVRRLGAAGGDEAAVALAELALVLPPVIAAHAVAALPGTASAQVPKLLRELSRQSHAVAARSQALRELAALGPAELDWLARRWSREQDPMVRREILQVLMEREAPGLERMVVAAAEQDDPALRAQGLRGIGQLGLRRELPLVERELGDGNLAVRLAAVDALGLLGGAKAFQLLIGAATDARFAGAQAEVSRALNSADEEDEVLVLIKALGTRDEILAERLVEAVAAAAHHRPETCGRALLRALEHPSERVRAASVRGLVATATPGAAEALARRLEHRSVATRTDALWGLARLGGVPAGKERLILELARHDDAALRMHAVAALRWFDDEAALAAAGTALADPDWRVVAAAAEVLVALRRPAALPWLIAAGESRRDRLHRDLASALESMTGEAFGAFYAAWRRWLADQPADLRLPDPEVARLLVERARAARAALEPATTTYHGIPVPDGPVVFVLDISGSMAARRQDPARSDLRYFTDALAAVLRGLPEGQPFDVVLFGSSVAAWRPQPESVDPARVAEAVALLEGTAPAGGTNLYDALELALGMDGVQTIFLLTDGQPTAGKRTAPGDILLGIEYRNRDLGVRIHTVAAGTAAADFLARLAANNGGQAVDLRR